MEYWTIPLCTLIVALSIHYFLKNFNFFKRNGILHVSVLKFGGIVSLVFRQRSFANYTQKLYNCMPDAKYFGFYVGTRPAILLRDPELIKDIFIKNFDSFPNRRGFGDFTDNLISKNLAALRGQKWRDVRTLLSPAFTSSKMKYMFTLMSECAMDFSKGLVEMAANQSETDMKDVLTRYTNDVIATCAFGIKVDSMKNPTNSFYMMGKDVTSFFQSQPLKFLLIRIFPPIARVLRLKLIKESTSKFFKSTIKDTMDVRNAKNITRPDMIQLMMDMRDKRGSEKEFTIEDMTAQALVFFLAGFETSSTVMGFIAYEIAANPDIQEKLQHEIDEVLEKSKGEVTYEAINQLKYLDMVICEILRLYPPGVFIERECERNYELPPALPSERPVTIKKGQLIWAPIYAIHRDKKYYEDPDKFRPERFVDTNSNHVSSCYAPFGLGPRMCIANRFALLEIKVLMFHLLARCELKPCAKTILPIKLSKKGVALIPEGGFWLNVQHRNNVHFTRKM